MGETSSQRCHEVLWTSIILGLHLRAEPWPSLRFVRLASSQMDEDESRAVATLLAGARTGEGSPLSNKGSPKAGGCNKRSATGGGHCSPALLAERRVLVVIEGCTPLTLQRAGQRAMPSGNAIYGQSI